MARLRGRTARQEIQAERPYALASVLYDVLNRVALEATLGKARPRLMKSIWRWGI